MNGVNKSLVGAVVCLVLVVVILIYSLPTKEGKADAQTSVSAEARQAESSAVKVVLLPCSVKYVSSHFGAHLTRPMRPDEISEDITAWDRITGKKLYVLRENVCKNAPS